MSEAQHPSPASETPENGSSALETLMAGPRKLALLIGFGGLIAFAILTGILASAKGITFPKQAFMSYQSGILYWLFLAVGSMFLILIQYLTGGRWGILMRRIFEANVRTMLLGFVLFIPVIVSMFMGEKSSFWWAGHHHGETHDKALMEEQKASKATTWKEAMNREEVANPNLEADVEAKVEEYLNPKFTAARALVFWGLWGMIAFFLHKYGLKAERDGDASARAKQKYVASIGLFVFSITVTMAVTDWVMSLEETFASSMFPVIYFGNSMICSFGFAIIVLIWLNRNGQMPYYKTSEQIHLGSLFLAFALFWAYTNFAQYMLTWVANLAEEIPYYLKRTRGGWQYLAFALVVFHFFLPFGLLLFRHVKSSQKAMTRIAVMLMAVCFLDVLWWVEPAPLSMHTDQKLYLLLDVCAWVGIGGLWVWYFLGQLKKYPLVPTHETYILEAHHDH
ncbi:MAG: hypothetical protein R3B84_24745 [Zavarzinella sp.]